MVSPINSRQTELMKAKIKPKNAAKTRVQDAPVPEVEPLMRTIPYEFLSLSPAVVERLAGLLRDIVHPTLYTGAMGDKARMWEEMVRAQGHAAWEIADLLDRAGVTRASQDQCSQPDPLTAEIEALRELNRR